MWVNVVLAAGTMITIALMAATVIVVRQDKRSQARRDRLFAPRMRGDVATATVVIVTQDALPAAPALPALTDGTSQ